jgi:hypothetical protein
MRLGCEGTLAFIATLQGIKYLGEGKLGAGRRLMDGNSEFE